MRYWYGNQFDEITGGWTSEGFDYDPPSHPQGNTISNGKNSIIISRPPSPKVSVFGTVNITDFTDYSTLQVAWNASEYKVGDDGYGIRLSKSKDTPGNTLIGFYIKSTGYRFDSIDVSSINELGYPEFVNGFSWGGTGNACVLYLE